MLIHWPSPFPSVSDTSLEVLLVLDRGTVMPHLSSAQTADWSPRRHVEDEAQKRHFNEFFAKVYKIPQLAIPWLEFLQMMETIKGFLKWFQWFSVYLLQGKGVL